MQRASPNPTPRQRGRKGVETRKRGSGHHIAKERAALFASEPLCRECAKSNRVAIAVERDHIVPLHKGGLDTRENTQPLCKACHDKKTRKDMGYTDRPKIGLDGWPEQE